MSWTQYAEAASHLVSQKLGMTTDDYKPDYTRSTVDHFAIHAGQEKGSGAGGGWRPDGGGGGRRAICGEGGGLYMAHSRDGLTCTRKLLVKVLQMLRRPQ
jgi:hypothetical protein